MMSKNINKKRIIFIDLKNPTRTSTIIKKMKCSLGHIIFYQLYNAVDTFSVNVWGFYIPGMDATVISMTGCFMWHMLSNNHYLPPVFQENKLQQCRYYNLPNESFKNLFKTHRIGQSTQDYMNKTREETNLEAN